MMNGESMQQLPHGDNFEPKQSRKRRAVDFTSTVVKYIEDRTWQRDSRDRTVLQPTPAAAVDMLPPIAYSDNPSTSFAAKFVHKSLNKNHCSIICVLWAPSGRRVITGSRSGEFTLWNGESFNFEFILQAHDKPIMSMRWSYNGNWMVSGDEGGTIKIWKNNLNCLQANETAHKESIRDLSFCNTDLKFCSCSDDGTVKVWDTTEFKEERSLTGHGWNVKSVDWHPTKSLLVSGGKDSLVKLWDARTGRELRSLDGHKNIVFNVKWNQNGNWLLTGSKDQIIKLYDIRTMKELESFRGHKKEVRSLAWHPWHEEYFVSGSYDGSICHWIVGHESPQIEIENAHDRSVCDLAWDPMGYLLCSGGRDRSTKFWCRNRPGDNNNNNNEQGFGNFKSFEASLTPRAVVNEGSIPGIGKAKPFDGSKHKQPLLPGSMALVEAPPLRRGPHPSLLGKQGHHHHQQLPPFSSMPMSHQMSGSMGMQGGMNPQSHYMGGPTQMYPQGQGRGFKRPQMMSGYNNNPYQQQQPPLPLGPPTNTQ